MSEKFEHKKSLGQHFLNSDYVPKQMCDAGSVAAGDVVLEIGPGTGILTHEILGRGAQVIAVEADERAIASLSETFPEEIAGGQLVVHHMDARQLDFETLGLRDHQFKIIANIPYYISGLLFRQCLESGVQPTDLVFLVQKEVAERIARNKKESILSMSVKIFGEPTYICTVKRGHFTPPPAVDSAVVSIGNINRDHFSENNIEMKDFFELLHLAFGQKRKQLLGNLANDPRFNRGEVADALYKTALPETVRAEDLSSTQFLQLVTQLLQSK